MFKFILYKFGQFVLNRLSWKASYRVGVFLSDIQYYLSPRDRRAVANNLRVILGPNENLAITTREVFRNFGRYLVEFFRMERLVDEEYIKNKVTIQNIERIEQALEKGKGAIILTAHIGNWELGAAILSIMGYSMMAVTLPHKERPVNDLFNHQREFHGITIVPIKLAVRKCIETLKNNKLVALVADRDFTSNGEVIDFFGKKTFIPKGAAMFSEKTGAPILPVFLIRQNGDSFILMVDEPIYPLEITEGCFGRDQLLSLMKRYAKIIEKKIKQYPAQWLMFREFWVK